MMDSSFGLLLIINPWTDNNTNPFASATGVLMLVDHRKRTARHSLADQRDMQHWIS